MPGTATALATNPLISRVSVTINGTALPQEVHADLLEVSVQEDLEALGMFTLRLSDWDTKTLKVKWVDNLLFTEGNAVQIQMGYEGGARLTTLMAGEITGLEPEFQSGAAPTLTVRGYDRRHRLLRGHKTRSFVQMKDSDIARRIASDAGLSTQAEDTKVKLEYVLQHNQTDLEFLQERARRIGYEVVVNDKTLYFRRPHSAQAAAVTLSLDRDLAEFFPQLTTLAQVSQVEVHGWDPKQKQLITGKASTLSGMGGTMLGPQAARRAFGNASHVEVQRPVFTTEEARLMAQGQLHEMALAFISGEGVCSVGRPDLRAGTVIKIAGAGRRFSGPYYLTSTTHTITAKQGYRTTFTVRRNAT